MRLILVNPPLVFSHKRRPLSVLVRDIISEINKRTVLQWSSSCNDEKDNDNI